MSAATITSNGKITIPVAVRNVMGLQPGDRIEFVETDNGQFNIVVANKPVTVLKSLIRKPIKPVSIEDMNAAFVCRCAANK
jgi:AbrB family looped-hinge helix DNA binding protein